MSVIWQKDIYGGNWRVKIHSISDSVLNRGLLVICNTDDEVLFQREVPVDRRLEFGGTAVHMKQWRDIIDRWVENSSPGHPPATAPSDPQG